MEKYRMGKWFPRGRSSAGLSLTELVIATVVLAVGVVGLMATFRFLAINIQKSKAKSLANNLALEQVEIMKSKSYYSLLVTIPLMLCIT
jgi:Tfp pilus assembly protein PilV